LTGEERRERRRRRRREVGDWGKNLMGLMETMDWIGTSHHTTYAQQTNKIIIIIK